jgi:hypothetical protein
LKVKDEKYEKLFPRGTSDSKNRCILGSPKIKRKCMYFDQMFLLPSCNLFELSTTAEWNEEDSDEEHSFTCEHIHALVLAVEKVMCYTNGKL